MCVHIENMLVDFLVDFLKSTFHAGDFTRQFKCGDSLPILGNWNLWPEM